MPEDYGSKPPMLYFSDGGVFKPVGGIDGCGVSLSATRGEGGWTAEQARVAFKPFSVSLVADVVEYGEAISKLRNVNLTTEDQVMRIRFRLHREEHRFPYRHRYVWQYRMERKGNRANRRGARPREHWKEVGRCHTT